MEPNEVVLKKNSSVSAGWMCSACKAVEPTWLLADICCRPHACSGCGKPIATEDHLCADCRARGVSSHEEASHQGATEVAYIDYRQPYLYWERTDDRGGFFSNKGALEEHCVRHQLSRPRWVWGTLPKGFLIDVEEVLARALEDLHDEARNLIPASEVERLQTFLDEWAMAQDTQCFDVDYDTAVVFDIPSESP